MGKKDKRKKFQFEDDEDGLQGAKERASKSANSASSGDEEANEDLSLKIVQKALLLRSAKLVSDADDNKNASGEPSGNNANAGVGYVELFSSPLDEVEAGAGTSVTSANGITAASEVQELGSKKVTKKKRRRKDKKLGTELQNVVVTEGEKTETSEIIDQVDSVEPNSTEIPDNKVFRKLLRGPRYFDPPDSWGACYNCGEEGHNAVNCTSVKRRRPCFVCGSLEHNAKSCSKGRDCFICKKVGHRAKDCPEKHRDASSSSKICLKCGDSGHDMFSCQNHYSDDDLKNIQCYVCKKFGHLCCVNSTSDASIDISCYKCGQIGHTGLACSRSRGEASGAASPSSCFRCGEEGHFARECTSTTKVDKRGSQGSQGSKRNRELSNTRLRSQVEEINHLGSKSAPHDHEKAHKKKKINYEDKYTFSPRKLGQKGRWMMEDPGNFSNGTSKRNNWNSPGTAPSRWGHREYTDHYSSPRSFTKMHSLHPGTPMSVGSSKASRNRYSASRFGDFSNEGRRTSYGRW